MRCKPFLLVPALLLSLAAEEAPTDFPNMAPSVGALLENDYYDQSRFKPRLMVERALRALEASEISIDTLWAQDAISLRIAGAHHQVGSHSTSMASGASRDRSVSKGRKAHPEGWLTRPSDLCSPLAAQARGWILCLCAVTTKISRIRS